VKLLERCSLAIPKTFNGNFKRDFGQKLLRRELVKASQHISESRCYMLAR